MQKTYRVNTFCRIVFVILLLGGLNATSSGLSSYSKEQPVNEKLAVVTDRSYYITGEEVHFRVFNLSDKALRELTWSRAVYAELITSGNQSVTKGRFLYDDKGANGKLTIPQRLPSGFYFLKVYTRWMRNFPASDYAWAVLKVLNPQSSEVLEGEVPMGDGAETCGEEDGAAKIEISRGDRAELEFHWSAAGTDKIAGACLTVTRKGATNSIWNDRIVVEDPGMANSLGKTKFLPETRGGGLHGKVTGFDSEKPVKQATLFVAELSDLYDLHCIRTDDQGNFHLPLKERNEELELFMCARSGKQNYQVRVEDPFCNRNISLPSFSFQLSQNEKELYEQLQAGVAITERFPVNEEYEPQEVVADSSVFFGQTPIRVDLEKYITLPNLYEVFYELVPSVHVLHKQDEPYFRITGKNYETFAFESLVLLDKVPVFDLKALLKIHPSKVKTIEVINALYRKGDELFGGVIAFTTKKGDLAGIELPEGSFFTEIEPAKEGGRKEYAAPSGDRSSPRFGNTLFWNPDVKVIPGEPVRVSFFPGDETGEYEIRLTLVTQKGEVIVRCYPLVVVDQGEDQD